MKSRWIHAVASAVVLGLGLLGASEVCGDDWPMFGRDKTRNAVSPEKKAPTEWHLKGWPKRLDQNNKVLESFDDSKNIKWSAQLGSNTLGDPVIADGLVWVGTNNSNARDPNYRDDASVLMCFRESDGEFLYQYLSPRLPAAMWNDWPTSSLASSPLIEGDRMWFATNRCETVCLDIGPLRRGEGEPKLVWKVDMRKEFGVFPRGAVMAIVRICSVAAYKDFIYVVTGNGVDFDSVRIPSPRAPSLVCFNKDTGEVAWSDRSPGRNILHGQWTSPLVVEINGRGQVITPQGDGWLRSFDALTGELIWKFDTNPKDSRWARGFGGRNEILATPVFYRNRVYIGNGQHPEHGFGPGWLYCLDPTKAGDISAELAVDAQGSGIPHRREQAVDREKGERAIPNPNSGVVWRNGGDEAEGGWPWRFGRTPCCVAIHDGLVIAPELSGFVHCLDAETGERYWTHDVLDSILSSPLIVDGKVYVGDEDGEVCIFELSKEKKVLGERIMPNFVYSSPVFANGVLYIAARDRLYAIQGEEGGISAARGKSSRRDLAPRAVFTPTPHDVVEAMLRLANVGKDDLVCDMGSGDGRIVVAAAKRFGCKAVGYEIDGTLVELSLENAKRHNVEHLVTIERRNLFDVDLSEIDVVTLYLLPSQNRALLPQLEQLKPGSRIVAHEFGIEDLEPDKVLKIVSKEDGAEHTLFLWTTPLKKKKGGEPN